MTIFDRLLHKFLLLPVRYAAPPDVSLCDINILITALIASNIACIKCQTWSINSATRSQDFERPLEPYNLLVNSVQALSA